MNILVNAIQAIESKGTIRIKTEYLGKNNPHLSEESISVSISDTGVGILPENKGKIFEPFFTTKEVGKGTGLGLSITYGIIEQHRGKIEVFSIPGNGTEFEIYLPIQMPG